MDGRIYVLDQDLELAFSSEAGDALVAPKALAAARRSADDARSGRGTVRIDDGDVIRVEELVGPEGGSYFAVLFERFDLARVLEDATQRYALSPPEAQALGTILIGFAPAEAFDGAESERGAALDATASLHAKMHVSRDGELIERLFAEK